MAKTLLRSGNLDDFQAVGGGGQAVFESALQIREALRLRKQQAIVDCLAIPQVNDGGDRVDWYSPVEGSVTSWKTANEDDRFRALRYLENTLASVESLSKKCLQSPKTAQQLLVPCCRKPSSSRAKISFIWSTVNRSLRSGDL
ncbi:SsrAB activated protein [Enterobacter cloacae]|uniref:SsrAB activated protein n=1 Tax=Enterobacter cloacae TaxID=550 RepID=A0A377LZS5_ENTCL|nr:SsrAB activated protein [Enterobacter cloacae]